MLTKHTKIIIFRRTLMNYYAIFDVFVRGLSLGRLEAIVSQRLPERTAVGHMQRRCDAIQMYLDPFVTKDPKLAKSTIDQAITNLFSDVFVGIASQSSALEYLHANEKHNSAASNQIYLYSFDYFNPKAFGMLSFMLPFKAATHCMELPYLFDTGIIRDFKMNAVDRQMLELMTRLWTNFAKYGNPNGSPEIAESCLSAAFEWKPISRDEPARYLSIAGPNPETRLLFQEGRPLHWVNEEKKNSEEKAID